MIQAAVIGIAAGGSGCAAKDIAGGIFRISDSGGGAYHRVSGNFPAGADRGDSQGAGGYIQIEGVYLGTLLKMVGITYIAEFASGICKDAGYSALGVQIEMFGKLSILAVSAPVLLALFETLQGLMG